MKYTTFCASSDYPNRMSGWLEVSFGADQGGKDRFCQLRQRVVDAHVFAYRGIWAWCTMASRINTRWQPPVTNFPPELLKMLRCSVRHRGEQLGLVIQRLLSTLKIALFYSVAAWLCLCWGGLKICFIFGPTCPVGEKCIGLASSYSWNDALSAN